MLAETITDTPVDSDVICPVTGLPIVRKPEWTDVNFGRDYSITVHIIGNRILSVSPTGYATLPDIVEAIDLMRAAVDETIGKEQHYVHISNYSNVAGVSNEARKYFADRMKSNERVVGMITWGLSPLVKLSVKLATRLRIIKMNFDVHIVDDYAKAVRLAVKLLSNDPNAEAPVMKGSHHGLNVHERDMEICHVTGLPITTRSEWTDIDLGEGLSVTFKIVGENILNSLPYTFE